MKLTAETTEVEASIEGNTTLYQFHEPYPDEVEAALQSQGSVEGVDYDWLNAYTIRVSYRADDTPFQEALGKVRTAGSRKATGYKDCDVHSFKRWIVSQFMDAPDGSKVMDASVEDQPGYKKTLEIQCSPGTENFWAEKMSAAFGKVNVGRGYVSAEVMEDDGPAVQASVTTGSRRARLASMVKAELQRGSKVQLDYPKSALHPDSNGFHFNGKTGVVVGKENTGRINMFRVRLDKPVMIPDHGPVKSDVWSQEYLKEIE
jgi:hypothetical protein